MKSILELSGKSNLYPYITKDIENIYSWSRSALICWIETFEKHGGKFSSTISGEPSSRSLWRIYIRQKSGSEEGSQRA